MKFLAPILVLFALLTDPQGRSVYVAKSQVVAITGPHGCDTGARAKIFTSASTMCVAEDVEKVLQLVSAP